MSDTKKSPGRPPNTVPTKRFEVRTVEETYHKLQRIMQATGKKKAEIIDELICRMYDVLVERNGVQDNDAS